MSTAVQPAPALLAELRGLAEAAARAAGSVAQRAFGAAGATSFKLDGSEVTAADLAAERAAVAILRSARPADHFITEENTAGHPPTAAPDAPADAQTVWWVIDPIDGTRNFVRGIPCYVASVAAMVGGVPVAGALHEPGRDALYSASLGGGAWMNGQRLPLSAGDPRDVASRRLLVAVPSARHERVQPIVRKWVDELVIRNVGSSAMHLAMVASGQLDAALLATCRLWDIAAGWLIVQESGGRMTTPEGGALFPIDPAAYASEEMPSLAARGEVHEQLIWRPRRSPTQRGADDDHA